jgi:CheY-like chemotaxis protein
MNLVLNAMEAVEDNGNIIIATTNRYLDKPLKGYDDVRIGEYAVLAVSDDGPGISSDDLKRIFEPFYTKKVMGRSGTGLGLTVVWNTVRDNRGYIDVRSGDSGTSFELYFPITREESIVEEQRLNIEDYMGNGERILVVDDEAIQRDLACKFLTRLGYSVNAVSSGEKAVAYLKEHAADLVMLDMIMDPGINGRETYERIIKIHPQQKAIIVSGFSESEEVKKTQKIGAGQYIKKPYLIEKLGIAVRDELKKGS